MEYWITGILDLWNNGLPGNVPIQQLASPSSQDLLAFSKLILFGLTIQQIKINH